MSRSSLRRGVLALCLCLCLCACGSGEAQEPRAAAAAGASLGSWRPLADLAPLRAPALAPQPAVVVGGRPVRPHLGLLTMGTPALSRDGAWAAWVDETRVTVQEVATGATRSLQLPEGVTTRKTAFFGRGSTFALGVALERSDAAGTVERMLVRYELDRLEPTHALSTSDAFDYCPHLLGTDASLVCVVDIGSASAPSYVLTLSATTREVTTHSLGTGNSYPRAAATVDGSRLFLARERTPERPASIVTMDLATGSTTSFPSPVTGEDFVDALAVDSSGAHLAVGTYLGNVLLLSRAGRVLRRAEPYPVERSFVAVSDDGALWDDRELLVEHRAEGAVRRVFSPCKLPSAFAITPERIVAATPTSLCVHDRATGAIVLAQSSVATGDELLWHGDELTLVTHGATDDGVPVPHTARWSVTEGRLVAIERTWSALVAGRRLDVRLPSAYTGTLRAETPYLFAMAGDRGLTDRHLIDLASGRELARVERGAAFRAGGRELVGSASDGLVIRRASDGSVLRTLRPRGSFARVVVSPDGAHAVLLGESRTELVSLADGSSLAAHPSASGAAFRPDGREVAIALHCPEGEACLSRTVRLALPGGTAVDTVESSQRVDALTYAPSGDALAVSSGAGIEIRPLN